MEKFVNPFSDYGFKLIFGSEISKDLIISFLNSVLQEEVIVDITFRNVEMLGLKQIQGKVVFDIFCENEKGESAAGVACKGENAAGDGEYLSALALRDSESIYRLYPQLHHGQSLSRQIPLGRGPDGP